MKKQFLLSKLKNQRGISAVLIAVCLVMLLGFVALAIDIGHLAVARNELQNAADGGALAGARYLYNDDGQSINPNANQIGYDAAVANISEQVPVEVNWPGGNTGDVQRGHWSFATRTFTPNASLNALPIWLYSEDELDSNLDFINAVRVRSRRQNIPIASWFAGIFGYQSFEGLAEAVAYIGFAGTVYPGEVDAPIAICYESIWNEAENKMDCNTGRMIHSGIKVASGETGGWTSLYQGFDEYGEKVDDPCAGGTNAQEVKELVNMSILCDPSPSGDIPKTTLYGNTDLATSGGEIQSAFNALLNCFQNRTPIDQPASMTLPVVLCPGNNITTCQELEAMVTVSIVHITGPGEDPEYLEIPTEMNAEVNGVLKTYSCDDPTALTLDQRITCWDTFVSTFELKNAPGSDPIWAQYHKKSIYFLPGCTEVDPIGTTGGKNFGILARIPVLVD